MTSSNDENTPNLDDVQEPDNEFLPNRIYQGHAGEPERLDDDALAAATEQGGATPDSSTTHRTRFPTQPIPFLRKPLTKRTGHSVA